MGQMLNVLRVGDAHTTGRVADAVRLATGNAAHITELVDLLSHPDPLVRIRSADALEKATVQHIDTLVPHKAQVLDVIENVKQSEVRWNLAQIVIRFDLSAEETEQLRVTFSHWFRRAANKIVRVAALQATSDLAFKNNDVIDPALEMLGEALDSPVASLNARARKLKGALERLKASKSL